MFGILNYKTKCQQDNNDKKPKDIEITKTNWVYYMLEVNFEIDINFLLEYNKQSTRYCVREV